MAEKLELGTVCPSYALLDQNVLSLKSFNTADIALLASSQEELDVAEEGEDVISEPSQLSSPAYEELLEVVAHAMERFDLTWWRKRRKITRGKLDKRFLS